MQNQSERAEVEDADTTFEAERLDLEQLSIEEIKALFDEMRARQAALVKQNDALSKREQVFRALVENSPTPIVRLDRESRHLYANPAFARAMGMPVEAIIGKTNTELGVSEALQAKLDDARRRVYDTGLEAYFEFLYPTPDGQRYFEVQLVPEFAEDGAVVTILSITHDVTRQKLAEKALLTEKERAQKYLDIAASLIIALDTNGDIILLNEEGSRILGCDREAIIGSNWFDTFLPENVQDRVKAIFSHLMAGEVGVVEYVEGYIVTLAGQEKLIRWHNSLIQDDEGNVVGILSSGEDITKRKQAEEELTRHREHLEELVEERTAELSAANARLQELGAAKDDFVSNVSHELRTPVSSLKLYHDLIRRRPERTLHYLETLQRETARLEYIIDDLLYLSRLDQQRVVWEPTLTDISQLSAQYVADRQLVAESKALSLSFVDTTKSLKVRCDPKMIGQVLSVLLTNAINYTPAGGAIEVSTQIRQDDGQTWAGIRVSDSGAGIPPGEQAKIFDRFYRGEGGLVSGAPGTGLGLAIAKEIIERHGGTGIAQNFG